MTCLIQIVTDDNVYCLLDVICCSLLLPVFSSSPVMKNVSHQKIKKHKGELVMGEMGKQSICLFVEGLLGLKNLHISGNSGVKRD